MFTVGEDTETVQRTRNHAVFVDSLDKVIWWWSSDKEAEVDAATM